jgi:type III secretion protein D
MSSKPDLIGYILTGHYASGTIPIELNKKIHIGYDFFNEVVLRTAEVKGCRLELIVGVNATQLRALSGCIDILGHRLTIGTTMLLPHYTPVSMGGEYFAFGYAGAVEWERSMALALVPVITPDDRPASSAQENKRKPWTKLLISAIPEIDKMPSGSVLSAIAIVIGLVGLGLWNINIAGLIGVKRSAHQIKKDFENIGASAIKIKETDKGLVISAFVDSKAQANAISKYIIDHKQKAKLFISTGAEVEKSVTDILRVQGISGDVQYAGRRSVQISVQSQDKSQIEILRKNILRDVSELENVYFSNKIGTKYMGVNALASAVSNPGKRVSLLVSGASGYLVTADGGRYFIGATLPTGYQIMSIEQQQIMLQQNGTTVKWLF